MANWHWNDKRSFNWINFCYIFKFSNFIYRIFFFLCFIEENKLKKKKKCILWVLSREILLGQVKRQVGQGAHRHVHLDKASQSKNLFYFFLKITEKIVVAFFFQIQNFNRNTMRYYSEACLKLCRPFVPKKKIEKLLGMSWQTANALPCIFQFDWKSVSLGQQEKKFKNKTIKIKENQPLWFHFSTQFMYKFILLFLEKKYTRRIFHVRMSSSSFFFFYFKCDVCK